MKYRELGKTGLKVSVIGLGTVELGQDYGIKVPGEHRRPGKEMAKELLCKALDCGINLFDTAPSYGDSEKLLGSIIGPEQCYIATKINIPQPHKDIAQFIRTSIEESLKRLKREYLDIVQIHNATAEMFEQTDIIYLLHKMRKEGLIRFIGASVYEEENAKTIIDSNSFDVLQIAYNLLDQRMTKSIIPEAKQKGIGLLGRSAYLRGLLTSKAEYLDNNFEFLKSIISDVKVNMGIKDWNDLTKLALRFCISNKEIDSILVGIQTMQELEFAIEAEKEGALPYKTVEKLFEFGMADEYWLNPCNWPAG